MNFTINGVLREFPELSPGATLEELIEALELKGDRVAVEHNGDIVTRSRWADTPVHS